MFIGQYRHNLDAKNRIIVPAKFRDGLGEVFVVTKGLDGCLSIYTDERWSEMIASLERIPATKKEARQYMRSLTSKAVECSLDNQGRIIQGGQPTFPIVGAGSIILGLTLALTPGIFINGLMYILGAIMILGGLNLLISLISARRLGIIHWGFWIAPCLILLTGLFVILKPMDSAEMPLLILGWCSLLYGVTELVNALKIHSIRKAANKQAEEMERLKKLNEESVAEEISSEIDTPAEDNKENQQNNAPAANRESEEDYPDFIG